MTQRFWIETLGCPKNQVDSDKLAGKLKTDGMSVALSPETADLVVVNTCAFIEAAREESIDVTLGLIDRAGPDAEVVLTGCMAERYGADLSAALPEVAAVVGFGRELAPGRRLIPVTSAPLPDFDLLNLARPRSEAPWAYVKIAEGCDRACGFCAIPSFRGPQRSRSIVDIVAEVDSLGVREVVLVAQDLASFGRDQGVGRRSIVELFGAVSNHVDRVRLLYLYPSDLTDGLIDVICSSTVPYFDLSLQHVSAPLLRRMRRWGNGDKFQTRITDIRRRDPHAAFRSNFIVGYPGETEADHDRLLEFVAEAQLDWCGFFAYSAEQGTYAEHLDGTVEPALVEDRLAELRELQDGVTATRRDAAVGTVVNVLVDAPGVARSYREAPEIDGIIEVPESLGVGELLDVTVVAANGPDLVGVPA